MKIKTGLIFVVFLSLIALTGCSEFQSDSKKESEPLVLRTYKVPFGVIKEIFDDLNGLL